MAHRHGVAQVWRRTATPMDEGAPRSNHQRHLTYHQQHLTLAICSLTRALSATTTSILAPALSDTYHTHPARGMLDTGQTDAHDDYQEDARTSPR